MRSPRCCRIMSVSGGYGSTQRETSINDAFLLRFPISCPMIHSRTPVCVSERPSRKGRHTSEISRSQDLNVSYDMHRMPMGDHDVLKLATGAVHLSVNSVKTACHCSIRHGPSPRPSESQVHRVKGRSFLAPAARCRDFARGHQVANVFLEKFVVVIELVVLLLDCFDPTEDGQQRVL